jgi:H+/Cl- antiporter ClcA/CBS domain-containing protein
MVSHLSRVLRRLAARFARPAVPRERRTPPVDRRVLATSALAVLVALLASFAAQLLGWLINLVTNLAFHGALSAMPASPADNRLGLAVILVPVVGGLVVGVMARYGSAAIRGHGIPEAMEQVLFNQSKIPARLVILKPISAAIAIGTGGPFGAEGPIIATGGALGSLVGQVVPVTADERKTLLAAGAAAGMTATFGSPVAAVLLAVELLLFEYRPRSVIPVALAAVTAAATRVALVGSAPAFAMPDLAQPGGGAIAMYVLLGALLGAVSALVTRALYRIEDGFARLPIHWMWWPAIGALAVGAVGYVSPHTLGVGYDNIDHLLSGSLAGRAALVFCVFKLVSWSISLGSGTSGGTLAPLFTIGGSLGAAIGAGLAARIPHLGIDPRLAALVGMCAMFAGASRAFLASVVFAFEATRQPIGLLPMLGGAGAAILASSLLMPTSIMTEKIARRGARVLTEYAADYLDLVLVRDVAARALVTLSADQRFDAARAFLRSGAPGARHTGFPIVDADGRLAGVLTRTDLLDPDAPADACLGDRIKRVPVVITEDASLREAADRMVIEGVGRLVVVRREEPDRPLGILTRSDLLGAHGKRLDAARRAHAHLPIARLASRKKPSRADGASDGVSLGG